MLFVMYIFLPPSTRPKLVHRENILSGNSAVNSLWRPITSRRVQPTHSPAEKACPSLPPISCNSNYFCPGLYVHVYALLGLPAANFCHLLAVGYVPSSGRIPLCIYVFSLWLHPILWTSCGKVCCPFSLPGTCLHFLSRRGLIQRSHCSSVFIEF